MRTSSRPARAAPDDPSGIENRRDAAALVILLPRRRGRGGTRRARHRRAARKRTAELSQRAGLRGRRRGEPGRGARERPAGNCLTVDPERCRSSEERDAGAGERRGRRVRARVRGAWVHLLCPAPVGDANGDGAALGETGPENLTRCFEPPWPEDRPHVPIEELREWFACLPAAPARRGGSRRRAAPPRRRLGVSLRARWRKRGGD